MFYIYIRIRIYIVYVYVLSLRILCVYYFFFFVFFFDHQSVSLFLCTVLSVSVCLCFCQTGILLNPPSLLLLLLLLHVISLVPRRDSAEERPRQTLHMAPHQKQAPPPSIARESTSAARDLLDTNWNILEDSSAVSSSSSSSVSMLQPGISDTPGVVKGMD